jgi:hypothetical protein
MSDSNTDFEYVFYVYDQDETDPRFSFWMETENSGISLFERPPDGQGMWLNPNDESSYSGTEPTQKFEWAIAALMGDGIEGSELVDLPGHERYFISVVHGTVDENPDAIPNPVWEYMHDCKERYTEQ